MPDETIMTAGEAKTRLAALDRQWADLQNAAVGRGINPIASPELADATAAAFNAYHQWRDQLGGFTFVSSYADEMNDWVARANKLRDAIVKEGHVAPLPLTEWTQVGPTLAIQGLGFAVGALGFLWLLMKRK
jgi:hypothetical protein